MAEQRSGGGINLDQGEVTLAMRGGVADTDQCSIFLADEKLDVGRRGPVNAACVGDGHASCGRLGRRLSRSIWPKQPRSNQWVNVMNIEIPRQGVGMSWVTDHVGMSADRTVLQVRQGCSDGASERPSCRATHDVSTLGGCEFCPARWASREIKEHHGA